MHSSNGLCGRGRRYPSTLGTRSPASRSSMPRAGARRPPRWSGPPTGDSVEGAASARGSRLAELEVQVAHCSSLAPSDTCFAPSRSWSTTSARTPTPSARLRSAGLRDLSLGDRRGPQSSDRPAVILLVDRLSRHAHALALGQANARMREAVLRCGGPKLIFWFCFHCVTDYHPNPALYWPNLVWAANG